MRLVGAHGGVGEDTTGDTQSTAGHEAASLKRSGKRGCRGEGLEGALARVFSYTEAVGGPTRNLNEVQPSSHGTSL